MGQIEIYELLKNLRETGDHSFYTVTQIRRMLDEKKINNGSGTCVQVAQLEAFGYLEAKMKKRKYSHFRIFRLKDVYCINKGE